MDTTVLGLTREQVRRRARSWQARSRTPLTTLAAPVAPDARAQAQEMPYIASMGIYVFEKKVLLELLNTTYPRANDFGSEVIPNAAKTLKVQAYLFEGYWEDIGTIKSFFDANLALAKDPARFEFYDAVNPIYTSPRFLPPAKARAAACARCCFALPLTRAPLVAPLTTCPQLMGCKVKDTILAHGVFMDRCEVENAIIGLRSRIEAGVKIKDAMIIGADFYETAEQRAQLLKEGKVPVGIGANSVISNAIIDKNGRIGKNCVITNKEGVEEAAREADGYYIRSGIVCVLRNGTIKDGTVI